MILHNFIPLLGAFFGSGVAEVIFFPVLCCSFVVTVPFVIRYCFRR